MGDNTNKFGVIESGEFGFFNTLDLDKEFNKARLICLTGKNGTGKTQILQFIAKKHAAKSIFNTTEFANKKNVDKREKFDPSRDRAIDIDEFLKVVFFETNIKDKVQLNNTLFKTATYAYNNNKVKTVKSIVELIRQKYNESIADVVLNKFMELTEKQKKEIANELYRNYYKKKHGIERLKGSTEKKCEQAFEIFYNDFMTNNGMENYKDLLEKLDKELEKKINDEYKTNSFQSLRDFSYYISKSLFNQININNLIVELGADIFEDYKRLAAGKKPEEYKTKWHKINNELQELSKGGYFAYKLVKPDSNLTEYDLVFEYIGDDEKLKNYGEVHFDDLSTGEKKIFTLMVYKYILKGSGKDTYEYLMLDEFDANLNPALIKFYINTLREIIRLNNDIKILFTTHSSLTLKALAMEFEGKENDEYKENNKYALYKMEFEENNDNDTEKNKCVKIYEVEKDVKNTKHNLKEIKKDEFDGFLEKYSENIMLAKQIYDTDRLKAAEYIIIVEGKGDKEYLEAYLKINKKGYEGGKFYIPTPFSGGASCIENRFKNLGRYYDKDFWKDKYFYLLFDFDVAGHKEFVKLKAGSCILDAEQKNKRFDYKGATSTLNTQGIDLNNVNIMMHKSQDIIEMEEQKQSNLSYVKKIAETENHTNQFEIENLICDYNNISLYNRDYKDIKDYKDKKKQVKKFFKEYKDKEEFNFKGFDLLFERMMQLKDNKESNSGAEENKKLETV